MIELLRWGLGALLCFGCFLIPGWCGRYWEKENCNRLPSLKKLGNKEADWAIEKERRAVLNAYYESGTTFGGLIAIAVFILGLVIGNGGIF